jgi:hypothetical protein
MQAQVQLPTSVSNAGNYSQHEDGLFPGIVQIPDHGAANAALGGIKPAPKNMKEPALVLCGQHSFGEPKDGACMDKNPRSGRYCRFARPRFAAETPVTTNAQAEPSRGFVHAPCPEQGTQSSVLSALFKKRSRKN